MRVAIAFSKQVFAALAGAQVSDIPAGGGPGTFETFIHVRSDGSTDIVSVAPEYLTSWLEDPSGFVS